MFNLISLKFGNKDCKISSKISKVTVYDYFA